MEEEYTEKGLGREVNIDRAKLSVKERSIRRIRN